MSSGNKLNAVLNLKKFKTIETMPVLWAPDRENSAVAQNLDPGFKEQFSFLSCCFLALSEGLLTVVACLILQCRQILGPEELNRDGETAAKCLTTFYH